MEEVEEPEEEYCFLFLLEGKGKGDGDGRRWGSDATGNGDEELQESLCHKWMRSRAPGCGFAASLADEVGKKYLAWGFFLFLFCLFLHINSARLSVRNVIWGLCTASGLTWKGSCLGQMRGGWRDRLGPGKLSHQCTNATPEQFPERSALQSAALCHCRTHSQALFKCKSGCVTRLHGAQGSSQMAPCL